MSHVARAVAGIAILVSVGAAHAQLFGGTRRDPPPQIVPEGENLDPSVCDQMASVPNAPMSPEACRSMMGMMNSMQAASKDPSAVRPGDEAMSCEQIVAEMRATGQPMVSAETAAQSKAAGEAALAMMQKQRAEAQTFAAGQAALGVGAGAAGMVPGASGYASQAAGAAMQARQQAFTEKQATEAAPVRAQMNQALVATGNEVGQSLQSNPRFARLMHLVADKNCPPPADLAPPAP